MMRMLVVWSVLLLCSVPGGCGSAGGPSLHDDMGHVEINGQKGVVHAIFRDREVAFVCLVLLADTACGSHGGSTGADFIDFYHCHDASRVRYEREGNRVVLPDGSEVAAEQAGFVVLLQDEAGDVRVLLREELRDELHGLVTAGDGGRLGGHLQSRYGALLAERQ